MTVTLSSIRLQLHVDTGQRQSIRQSPVVAELDDGRMQVTVAFHDPESEDLWVLGGLAGADPGVFDNVIADGAIPPVVAVLPDSLDQVTRMRKLFVHEPFVDFLTDELLPWATARLSFADDAAQTVVAGSSAGGLTAAYATCATS
jgi:enterochelin esterase-like enzyme